MTDADSTMAPLEKAAETAGTMTTEAFSVLGNETRLAILLALWEAYDPRADTSAIPFSELRKRVGMRDSGQFNYHVDKLENHFVRRTDDGYLLRPTGRKIVRAVIAGIGDDSAIEDPRLDIACPRCGASKEIVYEEETLYLVCTECEGMFGGNDEYPYGTLSAFELDPAGLMNRSAEEIAHAGWATALQAFGAALEGVCNECSGPIQGSLAVCRDHDPDGLCSTCGRSLAVMAEFDCPVCKIYHSAPPRTIVAHHPAVVGFYWDHGVPFQYETTDFASLHRRYALIERHDQELVSTDPLRVRVTVRYEADELTLLLDEEVRVVEVTDSR